MIPIQISFEGYLKTREKNVFKREKSALFRDGKTERKSERYGVAITECFETPVGHVVKVSKRPGGGIKIDHVWTVVDCGWYVNPDTIKAQVEGSIIMALGAATIHEVLFKDGMVVDKNFYSYKMPRITDSPVIEVYYG